MATSLCSVCSQIPSKFFSRINDRNIRENGPRIRLRPFNWIRQSASQGCAFCYALTAGAEVDDLSPAVLEEYPVFLTRATIDPHKALLMYVGGRDRSCNSFFRVPRSWYHIPLAQLNAPSDNLTLMRSWVDSCLHRHPKCRNNNQAFIPTRLLDLDAFGNSEDIRLVIPGPKHFQLEYVTLSHCWGPPSKHPLTTTKGLLEKRTERIAFDDLSRTFQDAVRTAKQLGQRYLWIDSLCIIQGDKEDWAKEAAAMAQVYGRSLFTLAALSSEDSSEGCRVGPRDQSSTTPSQYFDFNAGNRRIRMFKGKPQFWYTEYGDNPYRHAEYGDNPLRQRAWTLQERELSTRSIHFSRNMLLWECRTMKGSSELPWKELEPMDDLPLWPIRNHSLESTAPGGPVALRERWYGLVEDYSSRFLTEESDKLPALSGLAAKFFEVLSPSRYAAGLWVCHMPSALLWKTRNTDSVYKQKKQRILSAFQPRRPISYRAPSWTWASIDGEISYESQRLTRTAEKSQETSADYDFGAFRIRNVLVQVAGADLFGPICRASLRVEGCIVPVHVRYECPRDSSWGDCPDNSLRMLLAEDGTVVGAFYPDIIIELQFVKHIFCLSLKSEPLWSVTQIPYGLYGRDFSTIENFGGENAMIMGLGLLPAPKLADTYRRAGLIRWVKKTLFTDVEPTEITLL